MNNTAKQKLIGSLLYIVLALAAITVMGIGVFSFANASTKKESEQLKLTEKQTEVITEKATENSAIFDMEDESEALTEQETLVGADGETEDAEAETEQISVKELFFTVPLKGSISKEFSNELALYSLTMNDYRTHNGIDIVSGVGQAVCACADGEICDIYDSVFMGKCIAINHGNGLKSYYMNLSEEIPSDIYVGVKVKGGDIIAGIGETALSECADSPHLHFEIRKDGVCVNPLDYIDEAVFTSADNAEDFE